MRKLKTEDMERFIAHREQGHFVAIVTLSTYVQDRIQPSTYQKLRFRRSSSGSNKKRVLRELWEKHFMHQLEKRLPKAHRKRPVIDYEYALVPPQTSNLRLVSSEAISDKSTTPPRMGYHFHGLVTIHKDFAHLYWSDGCLNRHLKNGLDSFQNRGEYRPCRMMSFDFQPLEDTEDKNFYAWLNYINNHRGGTSSYE